ncbi:hypothetical protein BDV12DRAFT_202667 [Aspergillus spectabilis]
MRPTKGKRWGLGVGVCIRLQDRTRYVTPVCRPNPITVQGGKEYIQPVGTAINPALFNAPDDGTQIILYVPNPLRSTGQQAQTQRYPARNQVLINELRNHIGGDPEVYLYPYSALDYRRPTDKAKKLTTRRGMVLFQYDTDSDRQGTRAWRLLYEHKLWSGQI